MAYDIRKVTVIVDGRAITGFAEDNKVTAEMNEDSQTEYIGVDGESDSSINANESGTLRIPLKSTSPGVSYLNGLANSKKNFSVSVVDLNVNGINASGSNCFVRKAILPDKGKEISGAEFELFVGNLSIN